MRDLRRETGPDALCSVLSAEPIASQQDADESLTTHGTLEMLASSRDPGFLRTFVLTFLLLAAACVALNRFVNPLGVFSTGALPPIVWADADRKVALLSRLDRPPELLVLGSSRVMKFRPACLEQLTGLPSFNFGMSSAHAEDYAAAFSYALSRRARLRRLLIGVDPEAFHDSVSYGASLLQSARLRGYAPRWLRLSAYGPALLSWQAFEASVRSVRRSRADREREPDPVFDRFGFLTYTAWERARASGTFDLASHVRESEEEYRARYRGFKALDTRRVATLGEMLREAHARGIIVDAFIPPLHPALERMLARTTSYNARARETRALLFRFARDGLLRYHETGHLDDFSGDSTAFFDGAHMAEDNAVRLASRIYGRPVTCAVQ